MGKKKMGYVDTGYILGQHEAYLAEANAPSQEKEIGQDAFLQLLVAQLTNQDPMNPMDDKEMTGQLAEFSSLEQLTSINEGIESLNAAQDKTDMLSAVTYIGKHVQAKGYTVSKNGDEVSSISYGCGEAVAKIKINIYDGNGDIVRTVEAGSKQPGTYNFEWDGKDATGMEVPDGTYSVGILAEDAEGGAVMIQTEVSGEVIGVVQDGGTSYLRLRDGRYLSLANITEVVEPSEVDDDGDGSGEDSDDSADDSTDGDSDTEN